MSFYETRLYSILKNKCPHCHEGNFFNHNNPYNLTNFYQMDHSCKVCGEKFEREPGYYYGAMFVSYALNVAWFVAGWVATMILMPNEESLLVIGSVIIGFGLIMAPVTYRLSRLIWINIFVGYAGKAKTENGNDIKKEN